MSAATPLLRAGASQASPWRTWLVATAALASCLIFFVGNVATSSSSPATIHVRAAATEAAHDPNASSLQDINHIAVDDFEERVVDFASGTSISPPESLETLADGSIVVAPVVGNDAWCRTAYGYSRLDASRLIGADLPAGRAVELAFRGNFGNPFDQAGLFLDVKFPEGHAEDVNWVKAGIEFCDGALQVGAVVTRGWSDWSTSHVPTWADKTITIRVSRARDVLIVRAKIDGEPFRLLRLAYLDPAAVVSAGPYLGTPFKSGLRVNFVSWKTGPADTEFHAV
ncbi:hypothetical protein LEN26_019440 [Aphanomyces euteiches]|nr:hypothetical protein LEN26_019440 [Aphanomyces euteiches]